mmetsp:Transcript_34239/g.88463  ORF Transcript_34239/g.88463 Transcript_34239/m.88463 type:complete len:85 (+) Transcript_34239:911-1165(+)
MLACSFCVRTMHPFSHLPSTFAIMEGCEGGTMQKIASSRGRRAGSWQKAENMGRSATVQSNQIKSKRQRDCCLSMDVNKLAKLA